MLTVGLVVGRIRVVVLVAVPLIAVAAPEVVRMIAAVSVEQQLAD